MPTAFSKPAAQGVASCSSSDNEPTSDGSQDQLRRTTAPAEAAVDAMSVDAEGKAAHTSAETEIRFEDERHPRWAQ